MFRFILVLGLLGSFVYAQVPTQPYNSGHNLYFPYPVIFVHGLNSSADAWQDFYADATLQGWDFGGQIRFNLNGDGNLARCSGAADVIEFDSILVAADFYCINFNCDADGTAYGDAYASPTRSNQSAIAKQGIAVGLAVRRVLAATGRDKVILFGHSMGGLASRQYIQNSSLWPDTKHHVAKLITTATPHGGSNASFPVLSYYIAGVDERSEAVRDLRESYFYSWSDGVFLHGGQEDTAYMRDNLQGFYNYDVDCNGLVGGSVLGLNQKNLPRDLDFTCIVGDYWLDVFNGDLVVGYSQAQLRTYYPDLHVETFVVDAFHTAITAFTKTNFEGLDEPDSPELAYEVSTNTQYNGYLTVQATDAADSIDHDYYRFRVVGQGFLDLRVDSLSVDTVQVALLDGAFNVIFEHRGGALQIDSFAVSAGDYYLRISGLGRDSSWLAPYEFQLGWQADNTLLAAKNLQAASFLLYPNPTAQYANICLPSEGGELRIFNGLGQLLERHEVDKCEMQLYLGQLPAGYYAAEYINGEERLRQVFIKI